MENRFNQGSDGKGASPWHLLLLVVERKSRLTGEMSWHYRSVSDNYESFEDCGPSALHIATDHHVRRIQTHLSSIRRSALVCALLDNTRANRHH